MDQFFQRVSVAFNSYGGAFVDRLPAVLSGLLVLVLGWFLAKLLSWLVTRVGERTIDPLAKRSGADRAIARFAGFTASRLLAAITRWLVLLVFVLAAADLMGLTLVSLAVQKAFSYMPTLFTALAILGFGLWGADKASRLIAQLGSMVELTSGRIVGRILAVIAVIFASITALNVAGVDTSLITSNIQIILAGLLLAFAVAYGFAARDVLSNILGSYYGSERFRPGMHVRIGEDEGVIEKMDSVSITLRLKDRLVLIPSRRLVTERIEVLTGPEGSTPPKPTASAEEAGSSKAPFA